MSAMVNFTPAFFSTSFKSQIFFPVIFPPKHFLNVHIRIIWGNSSNALTVAVSEKALSPSSYLLVPCVFIQELHSTLLTHPQSGTGLVSPLDS